MLKYEIISILRLSIFIVFPPRGETNLIKAVAPVPCLGFYCRLCITPRLLYALVYSALTCLTESHIEQQRYLKLSMKSSKSIYFLTLNLYDIHDL